MPVDEYWLCLPASHVRPFVQTVRVMQPCPHCCWFPGALPSVPAPSCVPALLPRGCHSVAPPAPPSSSAAPFTSQASYSADRRLCPSSPTADGRQEKKVILNIPPKLFKATMKYKQGNEMFSYDQKSNIYIVKPVMCQVTRKLTLNNGGFVYKQVKEMSFTELCSFIQHPPSVFFYVCVCVFAYLKCPAKAGSFTFNFSRTCMSINDFVLNFQISCVT